MEDFSRVFPIGYYFPRPHCFTNPTILYLFQADIYAFLYRETYKKNHISTRSKTAPLLLQSVDDKLRKKTASFFSEKRQKGFPVAFIGLLTILILISTAFQWFKSLTSS